MTIEPIMSRQVQHCRPDHTLDYAAARMWEHDCGCLPVCTADGDNEPRVIGMLTDRDVCMAALFQGRPLHELKVADAMSRDIRVSKLDDRPEDVELLMREQRIRRVPVTDDAGTLVGIVSLADFARAATRDTAAGGGADSGAERDVGHTLAAICEPGQRRINPPS
jgi:CBS domain-containing protein